MSSIAIGVILLVVLLCGGYVMAAVLLMLSLIAYFELMRATGVHQAEKKCSGIEMAGYIGIVFHYGLMLFMGKDIRFFGLSILFVFFAVMIVYVLTFPKYQAQQAMAAIFSFLYAPVMLSFVYLLRIGSTENILSGYRLSHGYVTPVLILQDVHLANTSFVPGFRRKRR